MVRVTGSLNSYPVKQVKFCYPVILGFVNIKPVRPGHKIPVWWIQLKQERLIGRIFSGRYGFFYQRSRPGITFVDPEKRRAFQTFTDDKDFLQFLNQQRHRQWTVSCCFMTFLYSLLKVNNLLAVYKFLCLWFCAGSHFSRSIGSDYFPATPCSAWDGDEHTTRKPISPK